MGSDDAHIVHTSQEVAHRVGSGPVEAVLPLWSLLPCLLFSFSSFLLHTYMLTGVLVKDLPLTDQKKSPGRLHLPIFPK